jgi:hypothetical protein
MLTPELLLDVKGMYIFAELQNIRDKRLKQMRLNKNNPEIH